MDTETMKPRALSLSKAQIVLGCAFAIFVIVVVAIFIGFQSISEQHAAAAELQFDAKAEMPLAYSYDGLGESPAAAMDDSIGISDFGQRLDAADERLGSIEQSLLQLKAELLNDRSTASETAQSLSSELQLLKKQISELMSADNTLSTALNQIKIALQKMETEGPSVAQNELPVVGLKLLSVSIWDDGAVAIVSLGNRKTGLSVGNFFSGLKVEDMSVAEQSLTLYEPARDKLYTLYADAIVYKELSGQ